MIDSVDHKIIELFVIDSLSEAFVLLAADGKEFAEEDHVFGFFALLDPAAQPLDEVFPLHEVGMLLYVIFEDQKTLKSVRLPLSDVDLIHVLKHQILLVVHCLFAELWLCTVVLVEEYCALSVGGFYTSGLAEFLDHFLDVLLLGRDIYLGDGYEVHKYPEGGFLGAVF